MLSPKRNRKYGISVVVPCYNAAAYIGTALDSVLTQTRAANEIIIVDDGSSDDSVDVIERHPARPRIELICTETNLGSAAARNAGVQAARFEMVAMLDADDIWLPHHLKTVAGLLDRYPEAAVAYGATCRFGEANGTWIPTLPDGIPAAGFPKSLYGPIGPQNAVIMRASAVEACGGYNVAFRRAQDFDLWLRLSLAHEFVATHRVSALWRRHQESVTWKDPLAYTRNMYRSRAELYRDVRLPAGIREQVRNASAEIWQRHLWHAWYARDRALLREYLAWRHLVPGAERTAAAWRTRLQAMPLLRVWDRAPLRVREGIKRAGRAFAPQVGCQSR